MITARFEDALVYATHLHAAQLRKSTHIPYISHSLAVARLVLEHGGNEDEAIAALLHDAVEDQGGQATLDEIRRRFGDNVAQIVDGCTDTKITPKPPWKERKKKYLAHLSEAAPSVLLVSLADKLHNARAILFDYRALGDALWSRFKAGKQDVLWYYRSLVETFRRCAAPIPLVDELDRVVSELERLASVEQTEEIASPHGEM